MQNIWVAGACALTRGGDMLIDPRAQIEGRYSQLVVVGQLEPAQRIDDRKRLDRLLRIEIVPFTFVGKVKSRSDDGDAPYAAWGQHALGGDGLQRLLD